MTTTSSLRSNTSQNERSNTKRNKTSFVKKTILLGLSFCTITICIQICVHNHTATIHSQWNNDDDAHTIAISSPQGDAKSNAEMTNKNSIGDKGYNGHNGHNHDDDEDTTTKKKNTPIQRIKANNCGCPKTCTESIKVKGNEHFNCQTRLDKLMRRYNHTEEEACISASQEEEGQINELKPCGIECHPKLCHDLKPKEIDCGCPHSCDKIALAKRNHKFICKDRIEKLMFKYDVDEMEACATASQLQLDDSDGSKPCEPECHPDVCHNMTERTQIDISNIDIPNPPFIRYDGVVIVTKILRPLHIDLLKQTFCLFNAAYNRHVNYDIVIFTTMPWKEEEIEELRSVVSPAKLTVSLEGLSLEEHLASMTKEEVSALEHRCNVKPGENLTWFHHCNEINSPHVSNLGYAWQAEFRSYHIWNHPAISEYKYMMWLDADAMCTKSWDKDPMKLMVENDLVLMYDQFPGGVSRGQVLKDKMINTYNRSVCKIYLEQEKGYLAVEECDEERIPAVRQVYGFHHITNLEVYRKPIHQKFLKAVITNDYKFSRLWDDQLAVTVPAVMEDPKRAWDYRIHGLNAGIHHNGRVDGKEKPQYINYINAWVHGHKKNWTAGRAMCDGLVAAIG